MGSSAVQVAKLLGGVVTAVTTNVALLERLGADHLIDHRRQPVQGLAARFDLVVDAIGNLTRAEGLNLTAPNGVLVQVAGGLLDMIRAHGRVVAGTSSEQPAHFSQLLGWLATGQLDPIAEVVGDLDGVVEAHRRIDTGRKVGNLVVLPN